MKTKKIVINVCYGGFDLSDVAYEKLIEYGIPVGKYTKENDDREVIFDRELTLEGENDMNDLYHKHKKTEGGSITGRYWTAGWLEKNREHPLLIKVVEELGEKANSRFSELRIVEIPSDVEYQIEDYDGLEHIAEKHRTWN